MESNKSKITRKGEVPVDCLLYFYTINLTMSINKISDKLTETELEVYSLLCDGLSNDEIANTRNVSLNTIKTQLKSIYIKLNVKSRTQAIAKK
jgi:ATP/maltotriose-dependent transcriptional regulator MalT